MYVAHAGTMQSEASSKEPYFLQTGTLHAFPPIKALKTPRTYMIVRREKKKGKAAGGHNYQSDSESWFLNAAFPQVLTVPFSSHEQVSTHHKIYSIFLG